ncbi:MAG: TonB-dependent receptor plug domain-containing protein [Candidatus Thiodiazotropha sp. (ex Myrtea spinifera)]|nr:TonB-dependent receptor plug domain-containing protein [Candidatus Thiodiazotropha sp. (ex Myrtea spinifera)]
MHPFKRFIVKLNGIHHSLWSLLLLYSVTVSAEPEVVSEAYFFDELPVALGATRLAQPLADVPTAMTIINKEMIEASGAMSIPDLLRLVPGFTVGFYAGSRATASYHGLVDQYARDMQVLIDGRSIYDPGYGGVSWADMPIDMDDINRIEVIRGPNATAYGSNAYAGVINIITNHPADAYGNKIISTIGESGRKRIHGMHASQISDFSYKLSASYEEGDGFHEREDSYDTSSFYFHGDKDLDRDNQLQIILGASRGTYEEGFSDILQKVRELDNTYNFQQLNWFHNKNDSNHFQVQFYHNHLKVEDAYESPLISDMVLDLEQLQAIPEPLRLDFFAMQMGAANFNDFLSAADINNGRFIISWLGLSSHRYDLEFEQTLKPSEHFRFAWGGGLRRDEAKSIQNFHQYEPITRDQARIFANSEWYAKNDLVFNVGGMLEDFEGEPPLFSYRGAVNFHIDKQNTFRINSSRAYRMPTLFEEHVNFVVFLDEPLNDINTWIKTQQDLDPQVINSLEIGYHGNFNESGVTVDVKIFKEKYRDIIISYRDFDFPDPDRGLADTTVIDNFNLLIHEGAVNYINDGEADIRGIEVDAHFKPTHRDLLYFGYSYLHTEGREIAWKNEGVIQHDNDVNRRAPSHTFSFLGSHRFDSGFQISTAYYFTDNVTWYGEGDNIPSYSRWDARLSKSFHLFSKDAEISLLIQNINHDNLDFYNSAPYINKWERNAYLQAKLEF